MGAETRNNPKKQSIETETFIHSEAAAKAIQAIEQEQRALYGGAIGYIGFNGQIDFALASRTLLLQQDKAITEIGATVTASSKAKELYETTNAQALLQAEKG